MTSYGVACGHWTHRKAEAASGFPLPDSFLRCGNYEPVLTVMPGRIIWIKMSTLTITCTLTNFYIHLFTWYPVFKMFSPLFPTSQKIKLKKKTESGAVLRPDQVNSPFLFSKKKTYKKPASRYDYSLFVLKWGINPRSINFIILSSKRPKIKDPRTSTFLESKGATCIHGTGC